MPRKTKTTESTATATAPVVNNAAAVAAPVTEKKTKVPKSVPATTVEPVSVSTTPVVAAPVVAAAEDHVEGETSVSEQSIEFLSKLQQLGVLISALKTEYRTLEKKWTRELKTAQKQSSKRKRKAGNRAPSGFVKPTRISDELAKFLEKPTGSEMARTEVTRDINNYIRKNQLQDKDNGRKINPDAKLAALLKLNKTDELTYFNLQRYMSPHFSKATKEVVATA
jgi:upstream activation factor subunit UAF30